MREEAAGKTRIPEITDSRSPDSRNPGFQKARTPENPDSRNSNSRTRIPEIQDSRNQKSEQSNCKIQKSRNIISRNTNTREQEIQNDGHRVNTTIGSLRSARRITRWRNERIRGRGKSGLGFGARASGARGWLSVRPSVRPPPPPSAAAAAVRPRRGPRPPDVMTPHP